MSKKQEHIYLLRGNYFERKRILDKIKGALPQSDVFVFDESCSYKFVEQQIMQMSCFDTTRLVIIKNWPITTGPNKQAIQQKVLKKFVKLIPHIPYECVVVFNGINVKSKPFITEVEKKGRVFVFEQRTLKGKTIDKIISFFSTRDKTVSNEDATAMSEYVSLGSKEIDLDVLHIIMKQIDEYTGSRKTVKLEDIHKICSQRKEFIIWSLFNALDEKDAPKSINLLRSSISSVKSVEDELLKMFYTINWRYTLLASVRNYYDSKYPKKGIWGEISKLKKMERVKTNGKADSNSYVKLQNKVDDKTGKEVNKYTESMVGSLFNGYYGKQPVVAVYDSDQLLLINYAIGKIYGRMRAECSDAELILLMEVLFLVICGNIDHVSKIDVLESKYLLEV